MWNHTHKHTNATQWSFFPDLYFGRGITTWIKYTFSYMHLMFWQQNKKVFKEYGFLTQVLFHYCPFPRPFFSAPLGRKAHHLLHMTQNQNKFKSGHTVAWRVSLKTTGGWRLTDWWPLCFLVCHYLDHTRQKQWGLFLATWQQMRKQMKRLNVLNSKHKRAQPKDILQVIKWISSSYIIKKLKDASHCHLTPPF